MAAVVVSPDCRCGHLASQHRGGTYACRDCDCRRYEPDIAGVALARDTESTSAALARVTAERDELAQQLRAVNDERTAALAAAIRVRKARDIVAAERDELAARLKQMSEFRAEAVAAVADMRARRDQIADNAEAWHAEWLAAREEIDRLTSRKTD